ncbi:transcription initiation factor TFIID, subunit TAF5 [Neohortaea acidophila]|uniref:Transcription initiation factor TFIID, subunit TAF5 n=1 Tax=Neohortaea acidophila TaxID=245834 RepID=A0A6A6PN69_9PEZI|nr:transcription initiation factor TFIID, subunit TAF5 [Neohortaea acidophila]KAF2481550.1 transcription initiation factor TFIID, subunit TAF5 [Neohortaea acidophila]
MAQPPPPQRTGSVGPASAGGMGAPQSANTPGGQGQGGQQNLNQIVLEYLSKKGYSRTEAMLRRESAHTDANGQPILTRFDDIGGRKYTKAFTLVQNWIDNILDIYKPELRRVLWPIFVHFFLGLIADFFPRDAEDFFQTFKGPFENEHEDDLRALAPLNLPEHVQQSEIGKLYRDNRYRITLSSMAYMTLMQFLESHDREGGSLITTTLNTHFDLRSVDRANAGGARGLAKLLADRNGDADEPAEDEGIPGHNAGSANLDRNAPTVLSKLSLGPMPMESDLMEDVKAELQDLDASNPPKAGQNSLMDEFEERIKREPMDDVPSRDTLPFPPSTARDVAMEVQKVKENRDRFRIEGRDGRSGGIGPGVSVTMFTFHNTFDTVNCIEFSGDNSLVAIGTAESYIRVWSLDNQPLVTASDPAGTPPPASRRLIGHSGAVYAISFSPSIAIPTNDHADSPTSPDSRPRYLVSGSADKSIRLWSLDTWTNLVVYNGHQSPVWDVRFCPHGHYFASASADRTAMLWSTPHIAPLRIFAGHDSDAEALAWHPNGAYVFTASGGGDKTVRMWEIVRGSAVRLFTGHTGNVTALACSPSGHFLASADDRGEIILWNLPTGRLQKRMRGHGRGGIWSLDWCVESTLLVSGGADGTVRVWDVQSNKETQGKAISEGGAGGAAKMDGASGGGASSGVAKSKAKKDVVVSPDQISAFPTKKSPVYKVRFTQMNLVVAGGAYLP